MPLRPTLCDEWPQLIHVAAVASECQPHRPRYSSRSSLCVCDCLRAPRRTASKASAISAWDRVEGILRRPLNPFREARQRRLTSSARFICVVTNKKRISRNTSMSVHLYSSGGSCVIETGSPLRRDSHAHRNQTPAVLFCSRISGEMKEPMSECVWDGGV